MTAIASQNSPRPTPPTATIDSGVVIGVPTSLPQASSGVNKFLGIPYSSPLKRWDLPRKVTPWHQPLNASSMGPICVQAWNFHGLGPEMAPLKELFNNPPPPEDERCLTVNVYTPSAPGPPGGREVVVFIPGGGFQIGGSHLYDASAMAAYQDIVAVNFNYRTNIFGFPASPAIPLEQRNLGLLDQRFALGWIRDNIHAFGGDAEKVTVWGMSAGAESIDAHILTYGGGTPAPFRAAIMQSGLISLGLVGYRPEDNNVGNWNMVLQATNCSSPSDTTALRCLRAVPASKLKSVMEEQRITFAPIVDNVTIPANPAQRRARGDFVRIPVLIGSVAEEARSLMNQNINLEDFSRAFLNPALFQGDEVDKIIASYPRTEGMADFDFATPIYTDFLFQCPSAMFAAQTTRHGAPVWRYYFNTSAEPFLPPSLKWLRKYHGADYFPLFSSPEDKRHTAQSYALSASMRSAWARFVKNPAAGPGWPDTGTDRFWSVSVAVFGDAGEIKSSGVTVVGEEELDGRCALYEAALRRMAGLI